MTNLINSVYYNYISEDTFSTLTGNICSGYYACYTTTTATITTTTIFIAFKGLQPKVQYVNHKHVSELMPHCSCVYATKYQIYNITNYKHV